MMAMVRRGVRMGTSSGMLKRGPIPKATLLVLVAVAFLASAANASAASPANDNYASAAPLDTSLPVTVTGTNVDATMQTGEDKHTGTFPNVAKTVWYSYSPDNPGRVRASTCGSATVTGVGAYTGASVDTTSRVAATSACGDNSGGEVTFDVVPGTTYYLGIDGVPFGPNGGVGPFQLKLQVVVPPENDDFEDAELIAPAVPSTTPGTTQYATAQNDEHDHAGSAAAHSVWYSWEPAAGTYVLETCSSNGTAGRIAAYTGDSVDALTPAGGSFSSCNYGSGGRLIFTASGSDTYFIAVDSSSQTGSFNLSVREAHPPDNDNFDDAEPITTSSSIIKTSGDTTDATAASGEPQHGGTTPAASVWYLWTPSEDGTYEVDTCTGDGTGGTAVGVYTEDANVFTAQGSQSRTCNGGAGVTLEATSDTTYAVAVDGKGTPGAFKLRIHQPSPPPNDDFASAIEIASGGPTDGTTLDATAESGEPTHYGFPPQSSVWYSWTPTQGGNYSVNTCSSTPVGFSFVDVYTGSSVDDLTPQGTSRGCSAYGSNVSLTVPDTATTYMIRVDGDPFGATDSFTLGIAGPDSTPPMTTIDSGPAEGSFSNDPTPTFGFTANEPESTFSCEIVNVGTLGCTSPVTSMITLADGTYTFRVTATDLAGNVETSPPTRTFTVDTAAPEATITSGPSGSTSATSASFAYSSSEPQGATFKCQLDSAQPTDCTPGRTKSYDHLSEGPHSFAVTATDRADNTQTDATVRSWTVNHAETTTTTKGTVPPKGTVSTDPQHTGPTPEAPTSAAVTTPSGGDVTIAAGPPTAEHQGFELLGTQFEITAPDATTDNPLELVFTLDAASLPAGEPVENITVLRNGTAAANCIGDGTATPDPCVAARTVLAGGDLEIKVLSSHASTWNLAVREPEPGGQQPTTTTPIVPGTGQETPTAACRQAQGGVAAADRKVAATGRKVDKAKAKVKKSKSKHASKKKLKKAKKSLKKAKKNLKKAKKALKNANADVATACA